MVAPVVSGLILAASLYVYSTVSVQFDIYLHFFTQNDSIHLLASLTLPTHSKDPPVFT